MHADEPGRTGRAGQPGQEERERAAASLRFLARASEELGESLDYDETLSRVVHLAVPEYADWSTVDLLAEDGRIVRVAAAHADLAREPLLHETLQRYPIHLDEPRGVAIAIRTGQSQLQPNIEESELRTVARDQRHLEILQGLRPRSHLIVPLISHGKRLGALSLLYSADSGRRYSAADLPMVEDLGRRCGQAVENAQLYRAASEAEERIRELNADLELRVARRTEELRIAQAELEKTNQDLERRVAERTAALEEKNDELGATTQQLWQAAKLATMGELAASIAHELNNPLGIISLRIEGLLARASSDDPSQRALTIVEHEVDRMAALVANLLQFSRNSGPQISTIDLREELLKTLELMEYHLSSRGIEVVREFADDVPAIHADRQRLRQVFLNLMTNAHDAMPEGGTLTLRVAGVRESAAAHASAVLLEIGDSGVGIDPAALPNVMEPFYTTKPEGKGTGLGLAICRRIVSEHRGTFEITSTPGQGTTVRITLPAANGGSV
jgi:signal transduction histidine kinase